MMKRYTPLLMACLIIVAAVEGHDRIDQKSKFWKHRINCLDHVDFSIDDGSVMIYPKDECDDDAWVEITDGYRLYVNGRRIRTNRDQTACLSDYHDQVFDIVDKAKRIGWEGARVGVHGAKVGLKATVGVVKLLLPGYGSEDLERDLERETKKLEAKAESLEREAEEIEDMADDLKDMHRQLKRRIPELRKLHWF